MGLSTGDKLLTYFQRLETEKRAVRVNERRITMNDAFNPNDFGTKCNSESRNGGKSCFGYF